MPAPFRSIGTQNAVPNVVVFGVDGEWNVELVEPRAGHRQANLPAAVFRHEVDRGGRHRLRGNREVALVLAILVVADNDHLAIADRRDGVFDRRKRRALARSLGDADVLGHVVGAGFSRPSSVNSMALAT